MTRGLPGTPNSVESFTLAWQEAQVLLHIAGGHRRVGIVRRLDGVNAVAVGADRRLPVAARDRLRRECFARTAVCTSAWHLPQVAGTLNLLQSATSDRCAGRMSCCAVAVGADRGLLRSARDRFAVHALLIRSEGRGADAAGGHHQLLAVAGAAGLRDVGVRDFRLRIAGAAGFREHCRGNPGIWRHWCFPPPRLWRGCRVRTRSAGRHGRWRTPAWPASGRAETP